MGANGRWQNLDAPLASAVTCARLHAGEVLREWGLPALAEDAKLIVSELMTNAVKASAALPGRPPVAVRLLVSGTVLLIEAWDQTRLTRSLRRKTRKPRVAAG